MNFPFADNRYELDLVCRYTSSIAKYAGRLRSDPCRTLAPEGPEPHIVQADDSAVLSKAAELAKSLLTRGLPAHEILIVVPGEDFGEALIDLLRETGIAAHILPGVLPRVANSVAVGTAAGVIGLEADAVIVCTMELGIETNIRSAVSWLYVAVTRARLLLLLVGEHSRIERVLGELSVPK